ncbi:prolyl 4-hydroxylase subunit alpha-1-like isoform X1 [Acropora millepora]|uniref:prolyl 4-hydroxylase subunit alpha-1-like isoform X1 n=1 Tax=Acropora millepora TaxID=45264 RepID=UPI001CF1BAE7|nr:prolyl 4-hydroxylase subunit alpha-1-like isoform X1 [Acropora millepora]
MASDVCYLFSLSLFISSIIFSRTRAEAFTALVDLENLVYRERELKFELQNYVNLELERLNKLQKFLDKVNAAHEGVGSDVSRYLGHPVNSYLEIRRFYKDWPDVERLIQIDNSEALSDAIAKHKEAFSDKEDYEGAIAALLRLQDTYQLQPSTFTEGKLPGRVSSPQMTLSEVYDVGRHAYVNSDMFYTKSWMEETLKFYNKQEDHEDVSLFDIYDHLSFSEYQRGNFFKALNYSLKMVELDPTHERAQGNVAYFGEEVKMYKKTGRRGDTGIITETKVKPRSERNDWHQTSSFQNYERLCRGEIRNLTRWEESKMVCWYYNDASRLKIKPAKIERVFLKPEIVIFRDVLSDAEMNTIKELASPRLRRATIQHPVTGKLEFANYRISKSGWLKDSDHEVIRRVSQRIEDLTGLTMDTAEELQIVNYGIAGHYEPHYDFARETEDKFTSLGTGNRIATFLAYMSNVEAGGGTVFTQVGTTLFPSKGDAAFWWNLKRSGDGDVSTRHAGCPVLVGSKWVANKWIHERGQEFRRRCSLSRHE